MLVIFDLKVYSSNSFMLSILQHVSNNVFSGICFAVGQYAFPLVLYVWHIHTMPVLVVFLL